MVDGAGHSLFPGFHLRAAAAALKIVHGWGLHVLGGELVSSIALPTVQLRLDAPFGSFQKTGEANPDIGVAAVAYNKGSLHFWYGLDTFTPAFSFNKNDVLNVGQHNWALAPEGAFTWLPDHHRDEFSSKLQYIVNYEDSATGYRSGNEFVWEYAGMRNITKKLAVGANGFLYLQTTDDRLAGAAPNGGNRGRDFGVGPQIRYHMGRVAVIAKYQKEMLVENRAAGSSFWVQVGVPLWRTEEHQ